MKTLLLALLCVSSGFADTFPQVLRLTNHSGVSLSCDIFPTGGSGPGSFGGAFGTVANGQTVDLFFYVTDGECSFSVYVVSVSGADLPWVASPSENIEYAGLFTGLDGALGVSFTLLPSGGSTFNQVAIPLYADGTPQRRALMWEYFWAGFMLVAMWELKAIPLRMLAQLRRGGTVGDL